MTLHLTLHRAMRRLLWVLAGLCVSVVALILLAGAALMLLGNTQAGQRALVSATRSWTGGQVQLQGLSGHFPDNLQVRELLLSDSAGPWLRASDVHLDWSPLALLHDSLRIRVIDAQQASVLRRPAYGGASARGSRPHGGASLPLALQIDQLRLPRLMLAAKLAGSDVTLRLQAAGSYRSTERAALQLSVQRLDTVPATYLATVDLQPRRMAVQMDVEEQANGPLANVLQLPGLGALSVHLLLEGPRTAVRTRLDATAGTLDASARGTLDLPRLAAQLAVSVRTAAMSPRPGLSWQGLTLQAQANGPLISPTTSAHVVLSGMHYQSVAFDNLTADLQGEGHGLSVQAQLGGLTLPAPIADLLRRSPWQLRAQLLMTGTSRLAVEWHATHPLLQAQGDYTFDLSGRRLATQDLGSFTATLPDLHPWTSLAHLPLAGRATLQGRLQRRTDGEQIALSAALSVGAGGSAWSSLLAGRCSLETQLTLGQESTRLDRAALTAPHLALIASGEDRAGDLNIEWHLTRADLAALYPSAAGTVRADGRVQGRLPRLSVSASADARLSMHQASGVLHASLQANDLPQHTMGRLQLSGALDNAPVALQATLQRSPIGVLGLQIAQGSWKSAHIKGELRIDGDMHAPQGRLILSVPRLADADTLIGLALTGRVSAQVDLQGSGTRQHALLHLTGQDLALGTVQLHSLTAEGSIVQPLQVPQIDLQLAGEGSLGGVASTFTLSTSGPLDRLMLVTHAAIGGGAQTATQLDAQAIWLQGRRQLQLTSLNAHYREQMLRLLGPAVVSFRDGVAVNRLRLGLPPAIVQLSGAITPRLALRATV
ncbi:MAG TPA: hypothetical protein VKT19_07590, partial [Steroidobacteraceae bacterium]|nr:hypothetical protein [Steroidobacteraceae bacterium]